MKTNTMLVNSAWKNNEPAASSSTPYQKNSPTFKYGCKNCVMNVIKLKPAPTMITAGVSNVPGFGLDVKTYDSIKNAPRKSIKCEGDTNGSTPSSIPKNVCHSKSRPPPTPKITAPKIPMSKL